MKTQERILRGAEELFFQLGIKSITMDEIAHHLGISKKTIYRFYKDKDDIVHQLMTQTMEENGKVFSEIKNKAKNIIDEIFLCMKQMQIMFANRNPAMFHDLQKYYPQTWELFRDFKNSFVLKMVEDSLKKGINDGYVRPDINIKILSRLRIEEIDMGFNHMVFPADKHSVTEVQLSMAEHFLYGICTLKGYKLISKRKEISKIN